ncbi:MAG: alpha/beta hydrolase [Gammaproteobacteria bacterium]
MVLRAITTALVGLTLVACTAPGKRLDAVAAGLGFERVVVRGTAFNHVVYRNAAWEANDKPLHVYLDGDGSPWLNRRQIAPEPTPREPLVLEWMVQDSAPSVYLGRPCYHGEASTPPCTPLLWTLRRYAPEIIDSMAAALRTINPARRQRPLVLIGYSGGGALAMLLAERVPETTAVLTIAGNLDITAWADLHGYTPLYGSLNPTTQAPLPPRIAQLHYSGGKDANIPPALSRAALERQPCAILIEVPSYEHVCCWRQKWSDILANLDKVQQNHLEPRVALQQGGCRVP